MTPAELRARRAELGLSQRNVAYACGLYQAKVSDAELGEKCGTEHRRRLVLILSRFYALPDNQRAVLLEGVPKPEKRPSPGPIPAALRGGSIPVPGDRDLLARAMARDRGNRAGTWSPDEVAAADRVDEEEREIDLHMPPIGGAAYYLDGCMAIELDGPDAPGRRDVFGPYETGAEARAREHREWVGRSAWGRKRDL